MVGTSTVVIPVAGHGASPRNDPPQLALPQQQRCSLLGPELMLVIDGIRNAARAIDMIKHAGPDTLQYAEAGQVRADNLEVMHCGIGGAETDSQAHGLGLIIMLRSQAVLPMIAVSSVSHAVNAAYFSEYSHRTHTVLW